MDALQILLQELAGHIFPDNFIVDMILLGFLVVAAAVVLILMYRGRSFKKNPKAIRLSEAEQRGIYLGAILAENNSEFCNSLQPFKKFSKKHKEVLLVEGWGIESKEDALNVLDLLRADTSADDTAWNMGRMVNVSRWSYAAGYISENEAWQYILFAERESRLRYANWEEFGKAYLKGREMWSGEEESETSDGTRALNKLLEHKKSPWNDLPLV